MEHMDSPRERIPQLLSGFPTGASTARLSPDELTAYFDVNPSGSGPPYLDLYQVSRGAPEDVFSGSTSLTTLNTTTADEFHATVSGDGLTAVFTRSGSTLDLFIATRPSAASQFGAPSALLAPVNTSETEQDPYLLPDAKVLYFSRSGGAGLDLYRAAGNGSSFNTVTALSELNTQATDYFSVITQDDLTIFWGSTRTDLGAKGGVDIYTASRASTGVPFSGIRNVAELNTVSSESPSSVSSDGCRLYFTQAGGIYVAKRAK